MNPTRAAAQIAALFALLGLAACQRAPAPLPPIAPAMPPAAPSVAPPPVVTPAPEGEALVWGRRDCKRASTNPEIQAAFGTDKGYCEKIAGLTPTDSVNASLITCMSERGYNYGTRTEHDAACAARSSGGRSAQRR